MQFAFWSVQVYKNLTVPGGLCGGKKMHGFTCGFGDLLLIPKAEKSRRHKLKETDNLGNKINARFAGVDEDAGKFAHPCFNFNP